MSREHRGLSIGLDQEPSLFLFAIVMHESIQLVLSSHYIRA